MVDRIDLGREPLATSRLDDATREQLARALNHLEEQVQAIRGLLEAPSDAAAILTQLAAARGTLTHSAAAVIAEACGGADEAVSERVARAVALFSSWERYTPRHDVQEDC